MTAAQIKSIVESVRGFDLRSSNSYIDTLSEIGSAASIGKQSCTIDGCLHSDIIDQLRTDGFYVEVRSLDDSVRNNATFVSWK